MVLCDKWVALKVVEFLACVACLVAKRVSTDDEARLALLLQKLSREWSLLNSVTWDNVGGAFADAVYGGYVVITSGLVLGRVCREVPRGRRVLEGWLLGLGMLFFLILGGLELASLDSIPHSLTVNAAVLGSLSLLVAALFLVDLMAPRVTTAANHSQTDITTPIATKKVSIVDTRVEKQNAVQNGALQNGAQNGGLQNGVKPNGHLPNDKDKNVKKDDSLFDAPKHGYTKFEENIEIEEELQTSKFGSVRAGEGRGAGRGEARGELRGDGRGEGLGAGVEGGNYVRLSDPMAEPDRLHYEKELAKFNERYFREYLDSPYEDADRGRYILRADYLPEPQTPTFSQVRAARPHAAAAAAGRLASTSPTRVRTVATPTFEQLEEYLKGSRARRSETPGLPPIEERGGAGRAEGRGLTTPTDPGYVQYSADRWADRSSVRTPRHSPT